MTADIWFSRFNQTDRRNYWLSRTIPFPEVIEDESNESFVVCAAPGIYGLQASGFSEVIEWDLTSGASDADVSESGSEEDDGIHPQDSWDLSVESDEAIQSQTDAGDDKAGPPANLYPPPNQPRPQLVAAPFLTSMTKHLRNGGTSIQGWRETARAT